MDTSRLIMSLLGTWEDPESSLFSWFTIRSILFNGSMLFYALSGIVKVTTDFKDITSSSFALIALTVAVHLIVRSAVYSLRSDELKDLIESLESLYDHASVLKWKKQKLDEAKGFSDKITLTYYVSFQSVFLLQVGIHFLVNWGNIGETLVFEMWTPFDNFIIGQLFQVYYIHSSVFGVTQAYNLLTSFTFQICAHIDILCQELIQLKDHFGKPNSLKAIGNCIDHHVNILRMVKLENAVVSWGIFTEFFMVSLMACTSLYIGQTGEVRDKGTGYLCFGVACAMPVILCWCGSLIENKSEAISLSAYSSGWEAASPKERKMLLMLMVAAKRNLALRITDGLRIGLKQYTGFLQTTYSYFTGLHALEG